MSKLALIGSLMSDINQDNFPKQLNKHLIFCYIFYDNIFYKVYRFSKIRDIFKGSFSEIIKSWRGKDKVFILLEFFGFL